MATWHSAKDACPLLEATVAEEKCYGRLQMDSAPERLVILCRVVRV